MRKKNTWTFFPSSNFSTKASTAAWGKKYRSPIRGGLTSLPEDFFLTKPKLPSKHSMFEPLKVFCVNSVYHMFIHIGQFQQNHSFIFTLRQINVTVLHSEKLDLQVLKYIIKQAKYPNCCSYKTDICFCLFTCPQEKFNTILAQRSIFILNHTKISFKSIQTRHRNRK